MYRYREKAEVLYGHFREFTQIADELGGLLKDRGWSVFTLWVPTVGRGNEVVFEYEFSDLKTMADQREAFQTDPAVMKVYRGFSEHVVQGSGESELLEPVTHIA
jgi:hypothetical protein